jgi:hypothetical protein
MNYIEIFSSYRPVNPLHLGYKDDQIMPLLSGGWGPHKTRKYIVRAESRICEFETWRWVLED